MDRRTGEGKNRKEREEQEIIKRKGENVRRLARKQEEESRKQFTSNMQIKRGAQEF